MLDYVNPRDGPVLIGEDQWEVAYARDDKEYRPIKALRGSSVEVPVLSRWSPTKEQRLAIADGKDIFLRLLTFGAPLQRIQMFVASDDDTKEIKEVMAIGPSRTSLDSEITHMTCPSRMQQQGPWEYREGLDNWDYSPNGDRICSFCGSLHPKDFMDLVKKSAACEEGVEIEPSDKGYKIYVGRPSVKNASEGGIKFYTWHLPPSEVSPEDDVVFKLAVGNTRKRFEEMMQKNYPK